MFEPVLKFLRGLLIVAAISAAVAVAAMTRSIWLPWVSAVASPQAGASVDRADDAPSERPSLLELSPQARANMKLVSRPAKLSGLPWKS